MERFACTRDKLPFDFDIFFLPSFVRTSIERERGATVESEVIFTHDMRTTWYARASPLAKRCQGYEVAVSTISIILLSLSLFQFREMEG